MKRRERSRLRNLLDDLVEAAENCAIYDESEAHADRQHAYRHVIEYVDHLIQVAKREEASL